MFKPYYGKCEGKQGKTEGCGKDGWITTNSRRLCQECEQKRKPKSIIPKVTEKKSQEINAANQYYRKAIAEHIVKHNGKCPCEECGINIDNPTGRNVSHIIPGSRRRDLYLHPRNNKILCKVGDGTGDKWGNSCHDKWEFGDRKSMKIYSECMKIKEEIWNQ